MRTRLSVAIFFAVIVCGPISYKFVSKSQNNSKRQEPAIEKALPNSLDAERSVLGAVVLDNGALLKVLPILRTEDFFLPQNRKIYACMEELVGSGEPIDYLTLCEKLRKRNVLESAGGAGYVSQLPDGLPRGSNVEYYARIVKEKAALRNLIYLSSAIQEQALAAQEDPSEIIERSIQSMLSLGSESGGESKIIEWSEAAARAVAEIKKAKAAPESIFRGFFGLVDLDKKTSGLRKKELVLIVAPTSHGKSLIAEQFAVTCDDAGAKGLIFSAEMSAESIALRQLAYEADVYFYYTRRPENLEDDKLERIERVASRERNIAIVDSGITPSRIWALSEARKRSAGLDYVIVDYDQLVIEAGLDPDANEGAFFNHQSAFIHAAQKFAKRIDISLIILAQLRKNPAGMKTGNWRPTLDDIYGSSAMRNDPDVIVWLLRDFFLKGMDKKYERSAKACVVKARNGSTGIVRLDFDSLRVRFGNRRDEDKTATELYDEATADSESEEEAQS